MEAPLALYRRYRPDTFAEVIGQDHVTAPLRAALAGNRVHHAYLFSGPRGCGKTTSARILARALNCEKAPVADPCGECQSCRDLARGGPGSIDVIEIDAASHGGVDDARDLRERAFFAPVSSRYKVYVIDEAHMVTTQGFNALLKLVEEPPPHLKFIFATTEPDKVIGTIRSRTHHYPFRLIPPRVLSDYLNELCQKEGAAIEQAVLPLVVRAGAGSARDALSVLDQLIGGATESGVTYELATALLGYTPDNLLDEVVDAFAANDGGTVFGVVDKVIETGQDPRRFTEDLLRRLRDLVIISAVPDASASGLIDVPEDQGERLVAQSARFGRSDLSRAADLVASGLTEMRGATAPRMLLELICARVLLPGADDSTSGVLARLDRLERRVSIEGGVPSSTQHVGRPAAAPAVAAPQDPEPAPVAAPAAADPVPDPPVSSVLSLVDVRRLWPDLLESVKLKRRFTWIMLSQNAQVAAVDDKTLTIALVNAGARDSFLRSASDEILRQSAIDVIGQDWRVETIVDPSAQPGAQPDSAHRAVRAAVREDATGDPAETLEPDSSPPPAWVAGDAAPTVGEKPPGRASVDPSSVASARGAIQPTRAAGAAGRKDSNVSDEDVHRDDPDADDHQVAGAQLLERELGARIIDEIKHD